MEYLNNPYFKDLYLYLTQNRLPCSKHYMQSQSVSRGIHSVRLITIQTGHYSRKGNCIISYTKIVYRQNNYTLPFKSFCQTPRCKTKTYLMIAYKFFIPDLMHYLCSYIKGCHIGQLSRKDKTPARQLQERINFNYRLLSRLRMDLKVMPRSHT